MTPAVHLSSVRSLVRYVDEEQAVIDTHVAARPASNDASNQSAMLDVFIDVEGGDGFHDEGVTRLQLVRGTAAMRFEIVHPRRWWPAGMGDQPLYQMTVRVATGDHLLDQRTLTLGLTSVRPSPRTPHLPHSVRDNSPNPHACHTPHARQALGPARPTTSRTRAEASEAPLLVNGQLCTLRSVLTVDRVNENQLLPATGGSLLLVRDHYAPDVLYDAADRAGILLIQCVPIHPQAAPEIDVQAEVDRLSPHPSLAGWFVGHLGRLSDHVATQITQRDPTHTVFRQIPTVNAN